jgi:hypothetical protein
LSLRIAADVDLALAVAFALMDVHTSFGNRNLGRVNSSVSQNRLGHVKTNYDKLMLYIYMYLQPPKHTFFGVARRGKNTFLSK